MTFINTQPPPPPAKWMVLDGTDAATVTYPNGGEGGTTDTASSSTALGKRCVITAISMINPLASSSPTLELKDAAGNNLTKRPIFGGTGAADDQAQHFGPMHLTVSGGFGALSSAAALWYIEWYELA